MTEAAAHLRSGTGAPLVFIHGYLGSAEMWTDQIARFSNDFDVIAPDLAGFGERAEQVSHETMESHAKDILTTLDALNIGRFALIGHSMGGMIAQEIIARAPDRVARLVLYGTGPRGVMPDRFEPIATSRQRLRTDGVGPTARRIAATWFCKGQVAAGYAVCERVGAKIRLETALAGLDAMEHWDGRAALARISAPTLVLWGDRDRSYAWPQPEALWRGISGAALAVVPGCAHNVHQEKPEIFNALIADFLSWPVLPREGIVWTNNLKAGRPVS